MSNIYGFLFAVIVFGVALGTSIHCYLKYKVSHSSYELRSSTQGKDDDYFEIPLGNFLINENYKPPTPEIPLRHLPITCLPVSDQSRSESRDELSELLDIIHIKAIQLQVNNNPNVNQKRRASF